MQWVDLLWSAYVHKLSPLAFNYLLDPAICMRGDLTCAKAMVEDIEKCKHHNFRILVCFCNMLSHEFLK